MKNILIYGNNTVSNFLINALNFLDYTAIDITNVDDLSKYFGNLESIEAVIDASNAVIQIDDEDVLFHNHEGITELLMFANRYKIPYLFVYREPLDTFKDSSLSFAFDNIKANQKPSSIWAKVQIEDVYGPDIVTSDTLSEYLISIENHHPMVVENDLAESYLLNQRDLISGIITAIKDLKIKKSPQIYTLFPEYPITEIELAHVISDLSGTKVEIEYINDEAGGTAMEIDTDATYPLDWYPKIEIEEGILELLKDRNVELKIQSRKESIPQEIPTTEDTLEEPELISIEDHDSEDADIGDTFETSDITKEDTDELDLFAKSAVDNLPTQWETGTNYYRPERNESTNSSSKEVPKIKKKMAAALAVLLLVATMLPSISYISKYNQSVSDISKATELIAQNRFNEAYEVSDRAVRLSSSLNEFPIYIELGANLAKKDQQELHEGISSIKKSAELSKYISLAYIETSNHLKLASQDNVLGATTKTNDYADKVQQIAQELQAMASRQYLLAQEKLDKSISSLIGTAISTGKLEPNQIAEIFGYGYSQKYLVAILDSSKTLPLGGQIKYFKVVSFSNGIPTIEDEISVEDFDSKISEKALDVTSFKFAQVFQSIKENSIQNLSYEIDFRKMASELTDLYTKAYDGKDIGGIILTDEDTFNSIDGTEAQDNIQKYTLLNKLLLALENKDILIYVDSNQLLSKISLNNWTGTLNSYEDDYFYITDTEVSDTKLAHNISRDVVYQVLTESQDNRYVREMIITYKNDSNQDFLNHIRILTPPNVLFDSASLIKESGEDVSITRSVTVGDYGNRGQIDLDLMVEAESSNTLKIQYSSPFHTFNDHKIGLTVQKQPGIKEGQLTIKALFPSGIPADLAKRYKTENNAIVISKQLDKDINVEIPL